MPLHIVPGGVASGQQSRSLVGYDREGVTNIACPAWIPTWRHSAMIQQMVVATVAFRLNRNHQVHARRFPPRSRSNLGSRKAPAPEGRCGVSYRTRSCGPRGASPRRLVRFARSALLARAPSEPGAGGPGGWIADPPRRRVGSMLPCARSGARGHRQSRDALATVGRACCTTFRDRSCGFFGRVASSAIDGAAIGTWVVASPGAHVYDED